MSNPRHQRDGHCVRDIELTMRACWQGVEQQKRGYTYRAGAHEVETNMPKARSTQQVARALVRG